MVRLADLQESDQDNMLKKIPLLPRFAEHHWVRGPKLAARRVAIVSTAGLHTRDDRPFGVGGMDYRVIPGSVKAGDLVMSHMSVNYDRSGFQEDWNVAFPLDRLREVVAEAFAEQARVSLFLHGRGITRNELRRQGRRAGATAAR